MDGTDLQTELQHTVKPSGARIAATARWIDTVRHSRTRNDKNK